VVKFHTKYFGEITANDNDKEIIVEAKINISGKLNDISIFIIFDKMSISFDNCVKLLDDYLKICENGINILKTLYHKNNDLKTFLHNLQKKYGEEKIFEIFGIKNFLEKDINEILEKMDNPNIRLEINNGKENIFLLYGIKDEIDEMIEIQMDKNYKLVEVNYYEW
jgi:hypothetical protein